MIRYLFILLLSIVSCSDKKSVITLYGDSTIVGYESNFLSAKISEETGFTVQRKGMSGQSFSGKLSGDSLLSNLTQSHPDVVIIHSVNDSRSSSSIKDMISGIDKICKKIISENSAVKIFICSPYKYGGVSGQLIDIRSDRKNTLGLTTENYANAIHEYCRVNNFYFIDLFNKCKFDSEIESSERKIYTLDGVHLNQKGNELVASEIIKSLNFKSEKKASIF